MGDGGGAPSRLADNASGGGGSGLAAAGRELTESLEVELEVNPSTPKVYALFGEASRDLGVALARPLFPQKVGRQAAFLSLTRVLDDCFRRKKRKATLSFFPLLTHSLSHSLTHPPFIFHNCAVTIRIIRLPL